MQKVTFSENATTAILAFSETRFRPIFFRETGFLYVRRHRDRINTGRVYIVGLFEPLIVCKTRPYINLIQSEISNLKSDIPLFNLCPES
ncbi:hypothetical protein [Microseira wollei]|uniref:Uncharacterized protein n=1 Tax=Microseira wollei NIES-4236 TaxID=2530354 RepID=A0AAV3XGI4_9CYAN|nr:hypothetical protein [Microseira wollei]GET38577.1 hypothetical protein MiSe_33350 [Microseira wollei NIES-4236]